jgi:signal transduction histidine kinase
MGTTHTRSPLSGRLTMPWVNSTRGTSAVGLGPIPIIARLGSLLLRPAAPPLALGLVVAASILMTETLLVYLLKHLAPGNLFGMVYLLGVLVISTGWGFGLASIMSLASAVAFDYLRNWPEPFTPSLAENWVAMAIFLAVALVANAFAAVARARSVEADQRRREAAASRDQLSILAGQQAALRRVAVLVAHGVAPPEVFSAVARELSRFLGVNTSALLRYQNDGPAFLLAAHDTSGMMGMPVGECFALDGEKLAAKVRRTRRAARIDYEDAAGSTAARVPELSIRSGVAAPIVVEGQLWGVAFVGWSRTEPLPPDTEARVAAFADLVAIAIANAETRAQLIASRTRIVAAADNARRRLERDLHDGAQQRLLSLGLKLRSAEASLPSHPHAVKEQISNIVNGLAGVSEDLREISHGIHPAILSKGGLGPALKTLARRSAVPVQLNLGVDRRLPESTEVAVYYVVAEGLTNAAKHAQASEVNVGVEAEGANLYLSIRDDGRGGADVAKGSGLIGLIDRVEALGGRIEISSPAGSGTSLLVSIPIEVK